MFYTEYTSLVNRNLLQEARAWKGKCTTPPFSAKLSELCDEKMHWLTQGFSLSVAHIVWKEHRAHAAAFVDWFALPTILGDSERVHLKQLEGMVMGYLHVLAPMALVLVLVCIVRFVRGEVAAVIREASRGRKRGRKRRSSDAGGWSSDEGDGGGARGERGPGTSPATFSCRPRSARLEYQSV
jgi:hypothetical protein